MVSILNGSHCLQQLLFNILKNYMAICTKIYLVVVVSSFKKSSLQGYMEDQNEKKGLFEKKLPLVQLSLCYSGSVTQTMYWSHRVYGEKLLNLGRKVQKETTNLQL